MLRADKAYSGRKNRGLLQARGITVVIPGKSDAIARRKAKGSAGGRPLDLDAEDYKNRNVVERACNKVKNWRGLAIRYDKYGSSPVERVDRVPDRGGCVGHWREGATA